jgi:DNA-binding MarR family transcriptional regulator
MARKARASRDVIRLDQFLPYKIAQLSDRLLINNAQLAAGGHKLTTQEWKALAIIADSGPMTPADIRRHSTQDKSTISWALKRLIRCGILIKTPSKGDARTFQVSLSTAGWAYYQLIVPQARALERDSFKILTRLEKQTFARLVKKLTTRSA